MLGAQVVSLTPIYLYKCVASASYENRSHHSFSAIFAEPQLYSFSWTELAVVGRSCLQSFLCGIQRFRSCCQSCRTIYCHGWDCWVHSLSKLTPHFLSGCADCSCRLTEAALRFLQSIGSAFSLSLFSLFWWKSVFKLQNGAKHLYFEILCWYVSETS